MVADHIYLGCFQIVLLGERTGSTMEHPRKRDFTMERDLIHVPIQNGGVIESLKYPL